MLHAANPFPLTGHSVGYIKIWLMSNYCYPGGPNVPVFMPALRKQFPFLFRDRIPGRWATRCLLRVKNPSGRRLALKMKPPRCTSCRAKRAVKAQVLPMLLSSVRAHLHPVTFLQYCPENKILFRCGRMCGRSAALHRHSADANPVRRAARVPTTR